eukprot:2949873-Pleurochrysis_carterae.AAC.1
MCTQSALSRFRLRAFVQLLELNNRPWLSSMVVTQSKSKAVRCILGFLLKLEESYWPARYTNTSYSRDEEQIRIFALCLHDWECPDSKY